MKTLQCVQSKLGNNINLIGLPNGNILIVGVVHGDEPQGKILIEKYLQTQTPNPNLLFIPCLNPDGLTLNQRTNSNNVDINRNFPTKNWGENKGENATCNDKTSNYYGGEFAGSEIETQFLIDTINKYTPKLIITIHSPYKVVNYDGPAKVYAERISEIIKYPVEESIGYPTPGSFGTWAGIERNIPVITLELDEICPVENLVEPVFNIFKSL